MDGVGAETYLRCRLEDALLLPEHRAGTDLLARVRAVLALGLIDDAVADRVLGDLDAALRMRTDDGHHRGSRPDEYVAPRIVVSPAVIACDWGTLVVTHVVFDADRTTIGARGTLDAQPERRGHRPDEPWMELALVDPSGSRHEGSFTGGSSDTTFDGEFIVAPPLDDDTAWVTVAGHRIELAGPAAALPVHTRTTDDLALADRARRHLQLERQHRHHVMDGDSGSEIARETFDELGLPVGDEPAPSPGRRGGPRRPRRGERDRGPRLVAVATTVPSVDGITVTLTTLTGDGEIAYLGRSDGRVNGDEPRAAFRITAADDLGNAYTAEPRGSGHDGSGFHGSVRLDPSLAPAATTLTVSIDTLRHCTEITVPLAWQEPR